MRRMIIKNGKLYVWPRRELSGVILIFVIVAFPLLFVKIFSDQTVTTVIFLLFSTGTSICLLLLEPAIFDKNKNTFSLHFWSSHSINHITAITIIESCDLDEQSSQHYSSYILKLTVGSRKVNLGYYSSKEAATEDSETLKNFLNRV